MTRTEVYQLRLTEQEKSQLARMAEERNISIAKLIRERVLGQSFRATEGRAGGRAEPSTGITGAGNATPGVATKSVARSSKAEQPPVKRQVEGSTPSAPVRGGVAGSTSGSEPESAGSSPAPGFDRRVKQLQRFMSKPNAERVARTELGLD